MDRCGIDEMEWRGVGRRYGGRGLSLDQILEETTSGGSGKCMPFTVDTPTYSHGKKDKNEYVQTNGS